MQQWLGHSDMGVHNEVFEAIAQSAGPGESKRDLRVEGPLLAYNNYFRLAVIRSNPERQATPANHFSCSDFTGIIPLWKPGGFRLAVAIVNSFFDWYIRNPASFCYSIAENVFMRLRRTVTRKSTARLKRGLRCAGTSRSGR